MNYFLAALTGFEPAISIVTGLRGLQTPLQDRISLLSFFNGKVLRVGFEPTTSKLSAWYSHRTELPQASI